MPRVVLIVPSYNSAHVLPDCLRALARCRRLELIVVDNGSVDDSATIAEASGAQVLRLGANTGFAAACNRGVGRVQGTAEWLGFVNPDVVLDGEAILRMVTDVPRHVVGVSPLLVDEDGSPLRDIARLEPSVWGTAGRYLLSSACERSAQRLYGQLLHGTRSYMPVEVTSGGCLLVRAAAFLRAGGFSDAYFFNMEDVELSCRLRAGGGEIVVDRRVVGVHAKGSSSASVTTEQRMLECGRAEVIFFARNRSAGQTLVVAASVFVGCVGRMVAARLLSKTSETWWTLTSRSTRLAGALAATAVGRIAQRQPAPRPGPLFVDA